MIHWGDSGIRNTFSYEFVDNRTLESVGSANEGVVEGGNLTESWTSDLRQSGSLTISGLDKSIPFNYGIRIFHTAEQSGEDPFTEELATLLVDSTSYNYNKGVYDVNVDLKSMLWRLETDEYPWDSNVDGSTKILSRFTSIIRASSGFPKIDASLNGDYWENKTFGQSHVWQVGDTVLDECQRCAEAIGGYLDVDTHGRVILKKYVYPGDKEPIAIIQNDSQNAILDSGMQVDYEDIVNRVYATYEKDDQTWYSVKSLDASHPWSFQHIGRQAAEQVSVTSIEDGDDVQAKLDEAVNSRLRELKVMTRTFSINMLYNPNVRAGEMISLIFKDSPNSDGENIKAYVVDRNIKLDSTMSMDVTLREVRNV